MSEDEQVTRSNGSVPLAYGNAIAWRWSREMPTALRRGFLTLLYALRSIANASGEIRFPDKPIRIQDIAKAAGASEKDARRYINAAIAAGVVEVKGEQRRGKPTLYVLMVDPSPDWGAAESSLKSSRRPPGKGPVPWEKPTESSGDRDPNQFGGPRPELDATEPEEVRAPATRMGSGPRDPNGSGDRDPNNPGSTHEVSQDGAEVVVQPQPSGTPVADKIITNNETTTPEDVRGRQPDSVHGRYPDPEPVSFIRCAICHERMVPRPGRTTHTHCTQRNTA